MATTADATDWDRNRCFEAGMNYLLTKALLRYAVEMTLRRLVSRKSRVIEVYPGS